MQQAAAAFHPAGVDADPELQQQLHEHADPARAAAAGGLVAYVCDHELWRYVESGVHLPVGLRRHRWGDVTRPNHPWSVPRLNLQHRCQSRLVRDLHR